MAGRGRGRQTSFTQDQLQVLGCVGKDMPSVPASTAPPPSFPLLMSKPVPIEVTNTQNFQSLWKDDFNSLVRDSPYYIVPKICKTSTQRYSDHYMSILENLKQRQAPEIHWNLVPLELRPDVYRKNKTKRRKNAAAVDKKPKKYKRIETLEERLKRLEEKEKTESNVEEKNLATDSEQDENEDAQEIEEDDEMDEENDYGNNYFDNGEAFNEEDDNLDDGPIY